MRFFRVLAVALLLLSVQAFAPQAFSAQPARTQDVTFTATSDQSEQRYVLVYPEGFDAKKPRDLLVALHGHGSDRWQFATGEIAEARAARDVAAKHGMLFASPDYRAATSWMGPAAEADVVQMIVELRERFAVERVFVCGASMGGSSALTFAALHPELVAGVAAMNPLANHFEYEQFQPEIAASFGGGKADVPEEYKRRSAEYWPERLTMPVAMTVGGQDDIVPPGSALRLAAVLARLQPHVLAINRPETGHTTSYEDAAAAIVFVIDHSSQKAGVK